MSDPTADTTSTTTSTTTQQQAAPTGTTQQQSRSNEPETFSREYVHELREENRSWRQKHAQSEKEKADALKAADDMKTTAEQQGKASQKAADARVIRAELKVLATKAGMHDLDGLALADLTKVKLNDKGEVEGAEAALEELKKSKPYLFTTQTTSSTREPPNPKQEEPKHASKMTAEEYAAARAGIRRR